MAIKINEEENKIVPMMRTIAQCYEEILKLDKNTCVTQWFIRSLCLNNLVKHFKSGNKILVNFDDLLRYLNGEERSVGSCM